MIAESRYLTREELYAEVWAKPVAQLAKEWRLSDVGLAKLCRRHDVPLLGMSELQKTAKESSGQTRTQRQ